VKTVSAACEAPAKISFAVLCFSAACKALGFFIQGLFGPTEQLGEKVISEDMPENNAALWCIHIYGWAALRAKIGPDAGSPRTGLRPWGGDEAEPEGCGGSTVKGENEVWPDFHRNPKGRGHFSSFRRQSSLADTRYASLLIPRTEKKWLPSLPTCICGYTLECPRRRSVRSG
jgi:hypothetical protein